MTKDKLSVSPVYQEVEENEEELSGLEDDLETDEDEDEEKEEEEKEEEEEEEEEDWGKDIE